MRDWITSPLTGDVKQVPGVGDAIERILGATDFPNEGKYCLNVRSAVIFWNCLTIGPITSSYQLIGKFLYIKAEGISQVAQCDAFYHWLQYRGVKSHINSIVLAIAEKSNVLFPGIYNEALYKNM